MTKAQTHTSAPWRAYRDHASGEYAYTIGGQMSSSGFPVIADVCQRDEAEANAALIAAAPDLLAALCALILNIDAGGPTLGAMKDAREAIDKATR